MTRIMGVMAGWPPQTRACRGRTSRARARTASRMATWSAESKYFGSRCGSGTLAERKIRCAHSVASHVPIRWRGRSSPGGAGRASAGGRSSDRGCLRDHRSGRPCVRRGEEVRDLLDLKAVGTPIAGDDRHLPPAFPFRARMKRPAAPRRRPRPARRPGRNSLPGPDSAPEGSARAGFRPRPPPGARSRGRAGLAAGAADRGEIQRRQIAGAASSVMRCRCMARPDQLQDADAHRRGLGELFGCPLAGEEFRRVQQDHDVAVGEALPEDLLEGLAGRTPWVSRKTSKPRSSSSE